MLFGVELVLFPLARLRERVGVRAGLNQRLKNALEHSLHLLKHLAVPESQQAKSPTCQVSRALKILQQTIGVLPSVEFDNQSRAHADEIHDVSTEHCLPTEPESAELTVAQETPKNAFGIGRVRAQSASIREQ